MSAPQKFVIPKENRHNIAFYFRITLFWGAGINRGNTLHVCKAKKILLFEEFKQSFIQEENQTCLSLKSKVPSICANDKLHVVPSSVYPAGRPLQLFIWPLGQQLE